MMLAYTLANYLQDKDVGYLSRFEDGEYMFFLLDEVTTPLKAPPLWAPPLWFGLQDDSLWRNYS